MENQKGGRFLRRVVLQQE